MDRFPRRVLTRSLFFCAFAMALGCAAPTIPLPPPALPSFETTSPLTIRLSSRRGAFANALIVVVNRNTNYPNDERVAGSFANSDGDWDLEIRGGKGDVLDITQEVDGTQSPSLTVVVP